MPWIMQSTRGIASAWWSGCVHTMTFMTKRLYYNQLSVTASTYISTPLHRSFLSHCAIWWETSLPLTLEKRVVSGSSSASWTPSWCSHVASVQTLSSRTHLRDKGMKLIHCSICFYQVSNQIGKDIDQCSRVLLLAVVIKFLTITTPSFPNSYAFHLSLGPIRHWPLPLFGQLGGCGPGLSLSIQPSLVSSL